MEKLCYVVSKWKKSYPWKCRSVNSILSEHEVENAKFFSLKEDFVIVSFYKTTNNVAFICKQFYVLTIIKELNFDCHLSNQDDSNTYIFINNTTKDQTIKEHKLYLFKHQSNLANHVQDLPITYWITKMHKNPISFRFIISSLIFSIKPLSKDIASTFKLLYKEAEGYHTKGKV